jgi:RimJ/RimL family protein N-acetyltransferase
MTVTIRRLVAGDGPRLRGIRLRATSDSPTAFGSTVADTEAMPAEEWERRATRSEEGVGSAFFVAEVDGAWVGIAGGFFDPDEDPDAPNLVSMWVDPAHRGNGLSRTLSNEVIDWARERGSLRISTEVTAGNTPARALYESLGFRPTGRTRPLPSFPELTVEHLELTL